MGWFRGGSPMKTAAAATLALIFCLLAQAGAAFGDDLKGYSIDATYTTDVVPGAVVIGQMPKHGLLAVLHHDRIYISVLGNVFTYSDNSNGNFTAHGRDETQLGKAKELSRERMRAWTLEPGRLLRLEHEIEGVLVTTFAVDPSRSTCTVSLAPTPDPQTGRMVVQTLSGGTVEIKSYNVSSTTCSVRKGNIFAADQ
jgi:hypothetical protein